MPTNNTLSSRSVTEPACWGPGTHIAPIPAPGHLRAALPLGDLTGFVRQSRDAVRQILSGTDDRLLVVAGPCSVHDPMATMEYAHWLAGQARKYREHLLLVMRACVEKPRTVTGWTGLVNDPHLDGSCDIAAGLRAARAILLDIAATGLPSACEWVDPVTASYLADIVTLGAIGAPVMASSRAVAPPCSMGASPARRSRRASSCAAVLAVTTRRSGGPGRRWRGARGRCLSRRCRCMRRLRTGRR